MRKTKHLLLFLTVALFSFCAYGQECVRLIRTKYDSAQNNEFNSLYPGKFNPWINIFNIGNNDGAAFHDIPLNPLAGWASGVAPSMKNPFSQGILPEYEYLEDPIGGSVFDKDYHWEDGWEVMWLNTGYFPNGQGINTTNSSRIVVGPFSLANPRTPYIILYNRYQGKLRIFANLITDFNFYHDARVRLEHPSLSNASGLFRHLSNYDKALDDSTDIRLAASTNHNNLNNNTTWWSTDFQLAYDPCICHHLSNLNFRIRTVKTYDVDLLGRSVQATFPISLATQRPDYANFLTNEGIQEGLQTGSLLYKSFEKMLDDYDAELDAYNTQMQAFNSPFNSVLRQVIGSAKTAVIGAGGAFTAREIGGLVLRTLVQIDGPSSADTVTSKKWAEEASKTVKGQLGKQLDFLSIAGFGKEFFEEPKRPSMPTAIFGEMRIAGTITDSGQVFISNFLTPGSYKYPQVLTAFNYPAYNEVPGMYALLRTPSISAFKKDSLFSVLPLDTTITFTDTSVSFESHRKRTERRQHDYKILIRLKDALKYTLNPALDFDEENTKLYVSFAVEMKNNVTAESECYNSLDLQTTSKTGYFRDAFPPQNGQPFTLKFESKWFDMESAGDSVFDLDISTFHNTSSTNIGTAEPNGIGGVIRTWPSKVWTDCMNHNDAKFHVSKVTMKVFADMYFDQKGKNGLQNNTAQSFTYLLFDEDKNVDLIQSHGEYLTELSEILRMKQATIVLTDETIETTDPFVFETIGNTIYVNAETIELNGVIDVEAGYKAVLRATKSIKGISGTTSISRDIRLRNVSGFSAFGPITPATGSEVYTFCNSHDNGYKANIARAKNGFDTDTAQEIPEVAPKVLVYPNPATSSFYIEIGIDGAKEYRFQVMDLTGRTIIDEFVKGAGFPQFEVTTEKLSSGTYFLKVSSSDGIIAETERIVIIK